LELVGDLDEAQRQRLLEIAGRCPVHRTLTREARIETTLRAAVNDSELAAKEVSEAAKRE
jgi:hypothetical protein